MILRIITLIILLASAFLLPFWATLILAIISSIIFPNYFEIIPVFLLIDLMYGSPIQKFENYLLVHTALGILIFAFMYGVKKYIIVHKI